MILSLGVNDIPYDQRANAPKPRVMKPTPKAMKGRIARQIRKARKRAGRVDSYPPVSTTGDVATILEEKYGVMQAFADLHGPEIADFAANALGGALESVMMGAAQPDNVFAQAESDIDSLFRKFIDNQELDGLVGGVPTQAALDGVNHRLKHPYAKSNPARPSFLDTGLYQNNFHAMFEK